MRKDELKFLLISMLPGVSVQQVIPNMNLWRFGVEGFETFLWGTCGKNNPVAFPPYNAFIKLKNEQSTEWRQGNIRWTLFRAQRNLKKYEKREDDLS